MAVRDLRIDGSDDGKRLLGFAELESASTLVDDECVPELVPEYAGNDHSLLRDDGQCLPGDRRILVGQDPGDGDRTVDDQRHLGAALVAG